MPRAFSSVPVEDLTWWERLVERVTGWTRMIESETLRKEWSRIVGRPR